MTGSKGSARLGILLALALGAIALLALPGLAAAKDRNNDRIPDRWEKRHELSLEVNQARKDQDRDGMRNLAEFKADFNPRDRDSDDDGVGDEDENAGTIASFDTASGKLTISLFGGETISGLVTDRTRIKCEDEHTPDVSARGSGHGQDGEANDDHDDGDNSGPESDNSGPGSDHSGPSGHDDNGTGANCTTSNLIPGAVVDEAELELTNGVAVFEEIELDD